MLTRKILEYSTNLDLTVKIKNGLNKIFTKDNETAKLIDKSNLLPGNNIEDIKINCNKA